MQVISGSMLGSLIILSCLYFLYVERTKLVILVNRFLVFCLLNMIIDSYKILIYRGVLHTKYERYLYSLSSIVDFLIVFSIIAIFSYFVEDHYRHIHRISFRLIIPMSLLGLYFNLLWLMFFLYCYGLFLWLTIEIWKTYKQFKNINFRIMLIIMLCFSAYYLVVYNTIISLEKMSIIESVTVSLITIICILLYMLRYKSIINDKNRLYSILIHDDLTNVYSKSYLLEQLEVTKKGIVFFIDINKFKLINNHYGHMKGDQLLREFSLRISTCFDEEVTCSRFGGDEFVILSERLSLEAAQAGALNLVNVFGESLKETHINIDNVGISVGIATFDNHMGNQALNRSDTAMYKAKKLGNNKIIVSI